MTRGNGLTNEELEEIRERADKATEGPWVCDDLDTTVVALLYTDVTDIATPYKEVDADFISNARQDIPKLLAEIDRLKQENERSVDSIFGHAIRNNARRLADQARDKDGGDAD
ncbi:hypothetical protein JOC34_002878 [Virgibacillus halotolerans]|uniref:hypothetical protein n=1 Tax=Virgibacillus halotolerans TaxID=1071053 RepID=UPI00195FF2E8|nr:hypothetical protein [Virgibacillus halotolerans]MBM7600487.1 hypothetical protein [Virgibacillus halotolerans]